MDNKTLTISVKKTIVEYREIGFEDFKTMLEEMDGDYADYSEEQLARMWSKAVEKGDYEFEEEGVADNCEVDLEDIQHWMEEDLEKIAEAVKGSSSTTETKTDG